MSPEFLFWWSVISTIVGVVLLCCSIWQYFQSRNERDKANAQVKVWMNDANGISAALSRIVADNLANRYSSTNDVCNAVWAIQSSSFALYQSLYEERCISEKEYKERQKRISDRLEVEQLAARPMPTSPAV